MQPPEGVLDRILSRREDGDRLILPLEMPPARPISRRRAHRAGAIGGAALLVLIAMVSLTSRATAGSSNLTITPKYPQSGDEVTVRYVATTALAGADSLRLRVRFREAGHLVQQHDYQGNHLSITLLPDGGGAFTASFVPPATASYAQMAVEDTPGATVDSNNGRLWEVLTYDHKREVLYEALHQRHHMAQDALDWRRSRETCLDMTRLFPGRAGGWYQRFLHELEFADPSDRDSVLAAHRAVFHRLESELDDGEVAPSELAAMMDYASGLGEDEAAAFWEDHLARQDPGNPRLLRHRVLRLLMSQPDLSEALAVIEDAWLASDPRDLYLAELGLDVALDAEQWERAEIWARRLTDGDSRAKYRAGRRLAAHSSTMRAGVDYLRRAATESVREAEWERPLGMDKLQHGRQRALRLQRIFADLADALVASGEIDEAAALIAQAASLSWDPLLLSELAEHRLEFGDTLAALDLLARAAADPITGPDIEEFGSAVVAMVGLRVPDWLQMVADRREELSLWMLEATDFRRLNPDVTVEAVTGERVTIPSLAPGQPTLVAVTAFLNGRVPDANLRRFAELHDRLSARAFPFVVLTTWGDRDQYSGFVGGHRPAFPVFHDPDNVAAEVLGVSRTTEYLVLDADGILRGTYHDREAALRLLYLLPRPRQVA